MVKIEDTHLTKRQIQVLELRLQGMGVSAIAKKLRTSKSNISRLLKTAEQNVKKSKNTMRLLETLDWPVKINIRKGSNVYEVAEKLFELADKKRIKIARNYAEIVRLISESLGRKNIRRRVALRDLTVMVSADGEIEIL